MANKGEEFTPAEAWFTSEFKAEIVEQCQRAAAP